jgi:excinuclease ABC subunit A
MQNSFWPEKTVSTIGALRMSSKEIFVKGAREHNLKGIDVRIPRDRLVVVTGLSGSGKSSLAFDTIYAEGQRRYVESLSSYARQFLEQMQKPDIEFIEGLPPTISIEQRSTGANPRSTVATTTEIYDYMRLLFARIGLPHCPKCRKPITRQTAGQIVDDILRNPENTRIILLAPLVRGQKGEHRDVINRLRREGFVRARVDGEIMEVKDIGELDKHRKHAVEAVVDRLVVRSDIRQRLQESVELSLRLGESIMLLARQAGNAWEDVIYSQLYACPTCGISLEELEPRIFSFNSPYGACPKCDGLGTRLELDEDLIVPDHSLSLQEGAINAWRKGGKRMNIFYNRRLRRFASDFGIPMTTPFEKLPEEICRVLLYGADEEDEKKHGAWFEGVIPNLMRRFERTDSEYVKARIMSYMSELPCPACKGARLKPTSLAVTIEERNIKEVTELSVEEAYKFFSNLKLGTEQAQIARQILKEIRERLSFMLSVGLSYITLDRRSGTLSGGEAQRIRLATQVGSGLVGVCYVLDEPTIGLHQRDNEKLIATLCRLRDLGNTVIVVEHDEETIRSADHIIDMGPGAGAHGGTVVAEGALEQIMDNPASLTGRYLRGEMRIPLPRKRRKPQKAEYITVVGAKEHNLKDLTVGFPLGLMVCVAGVSGSGKSTLVNEILYRALMRGLYNTGEKPGAHDKVLGLDKIDKVIAIDQSPIGRTPRSNPATYTGVFTQIRELYAMVPEAKMRGYGPGRFSFNVKGGRCEACQGQGTKKIEMHFLPDVYVICEECKGTRYERETLEIRYKGRSIAEVLEMPVEEALKFFANFPKIRRILQTLDDVGLGYVSLGQSSTTLSGGEAQRVKLATELGKPATGKTLYILDEPTTGLHFADINKLLDVLNRLVDMGNTIVVIEHNLDVIKTADYIIDLGPEGGEAGGYVVAGGSPEAVIKNPQSYTGQFLKRHLERERRIKTRKPQPAVEL